MREEEERVLAACAEGWGVEAIGEEGKTSSAGQVQSDFALQQQEQEKELIT